MAGEGTVKPRMSPMAWVLGIALFCGGALLARELRVSSWDHYQATSKYEDIYYLPPPSWLRVISLGHHEALADLLWMRALVYFGEEVIAADGMVRHLFDYSDAMLALDPDFRAVYRWVGVVTFYRAGDFVEEDGWRGIDYLQRAVERWPDDGEFAWDLGATLAFEMTPMLKDPDQKAEVKQRGLQHLAVAARTGHGPPWLALTNASMLSNMGKKEQAIRHLEEAYGTLTDAASRDMVAKQLAALRTERHADALRQVYTELTDGWRENMPYLSAPYEGATHTGRAGQVPDFYLLMHGAPKPAGYFAMLKRGFVPSERGGMLDALMETEPEGEPAAEAANDAAPRREEEPAEAGAASEAADDSAESEAQAQPTPQPVAERLGKDAAQPGTKASPGED